MGEVARAEAGRSRRLERVCVLPPAAGRYKAGRTIVTQARVFRFRAPQEISQLLIASPPFHRGEGAAYWLI